MLQHLKNGETLELEWAHQVFEKEYFYERYKKGIKYPIFPDEMTYGEKEVFVGLQLKMEDCGSKNCPIAVKVNYVNSVAFPKEPDNNVDSYLLGARQPENTLPYPIIKDTRYSYDHAQESRFKSNVTEREALFFDLKTQSFKTPPDPTYQFGMGLASELDYEQLEIFLKDLWQQKWIERDGFNKVQQIENEKIEVDFFRPIIAAKMTTISGRVINPVEESVGIHNFREGNLFKNHGEQIVPLDEKGYFSIQVKLTAARNLSLTHGFNILALYVEPGDHLEIELDANAIYRNTTFKGKGTTENQFLLDFYHEMRNDEVLIGLDKNLLKKGQLVFLKEQREKLQSELHFLHKNKTQLPPKFSSFFQQFLKLQHANQIWYNSMWFCTNWNAVFEPTFSEYCQDLSNLLYRLPNSNEAYFQIREYLEFQKRFIKGKYIKREVPSERMRNFDLAKVLLSPRNAFYYGRESLSLSDVFPRSKFYEELASICTDQKELKKIENNLNKVDAFESTPRIWRSIAVGDKIPNWKWIQDKNNNWNHTTFLFTPDDWIKHQHTFTTKDTNYLLLHVGKRKYLTDAQEDMKAIQKLSKTKLKLLSLVEKEEGDINSRNTIYLANQELQRLRDSLLISNDANHYYIIDSTGSVVFNPFYLSSYQKIATRVTKLPNPNKKWLFTPLFWQRFALISFLSLIVLGIYIQRKRRLAKRERARRQILELELKGIRSQMNPHFLFNALSSIQNLIRKKDEVGADRYLTQFAGLVRKILRHSEQEFITLEEEIEALQQYCSLEALRTPFEYEIEVAPEIDKFNTYLPSMLLQPLVENAILHGLMPQQAARKLWIKIRPDTQGLYCEIVDNGIGLERAKLNVQKHKAHQKSYGLALVRQRLELLMNSSEQNLLQLLDRSQKDTTLSGTIVQLIIPTEQ
ncbi:MAG: histidine kinase [Bacteroidota bacterium]